MKALVLLPLIYSMLVGGFFAAMCQKPEVFARIMAKTPSVAFVVLPFRWMWLRARAGNLNVGDEAPDFSLEAFDKASKFQLSNLKGNRPVVLVFGSYT